MKALILRILNYTILRFEIKPNARPGILNSFLLQASTIIKYLALNLISDIRYIKKSSKLRAQKNSKIQKEALVLGNGPSLGKISFEKIKEHQKIDLEIFVVNFFPLFDAIEGFEPNYLVLSDEGTRPTNSGERTQNLWKWIQSKPLVTLITPYSWKKEVDPLTNNVMYFNDSGLEGVSRNINPIFPRGYASMTAYKALSISVFMGYRKINILGIDNSNYRNLTFTPNNQILQHPFHFGPYGSTVNFSEALGFNSARYFLDLAQVLADLELFKGCEIFNLDIESVIDSFEKIEDYRFLKQI
jgi:hypothetical protein